MRKGSKATKHYFSEKIARMLGACEELSTAGEAITYRKLSEMIGLTARGMQYRVARLRKAGRFPHEIDGPSTRARYPEAIAAAAAIVASGGVLTYRAIAEAMACPIKQAVMRVGSARSLGHFPWKITPAPRVTIEGRARKEKEARERRMALIEPKHTPEQLASLRARVESAKAELLAECRAAMIDASGEEDDPPPGIPPRSNKDHAAWGRMKFADMHCGPYEPRVHRAANLEGRSPR